jgi:hypothetical protein
MAAVSFVDKKASQESAERQVQKLRPVMSGLNQMAADLARLFTDHGYYTTAEELNRRLLPPRDFGERISRLMDTEIKVRHVLYVLCPPLYLLDHLRWK